MDALIGQVLADVRGIAEDVLRREGVRIRTATVTSVSPLRIRYDGEGDASVVTPRTVVGVVAGDRVVVTKSRGQATVLGVLGTGTFTWDKKADSGTFKFGDHGGYQRALGRKGSVRRLRGRVALTSGDYFKAGVTRKIFGVGVPPADAPTSTQRFVTACGNDTPTFAKVEVSSSGVVSATPDRDTFWIGLDGIEWEVGE